jgi:hypothetical protein
MQLSSANIPLSPKKYETPLLELHVSQYFPLQKYYTIEKRAQIGDFIYDFNTTVCKRGNAYVLKGKPFR